MDNQLSFADNPDQLILKKAFERALFRMEDAMPRAQFEKFLKPLTVTGREAHLLFVNAPGKFVQEWVRDKYRNQLEELLSEELGETVELVLEATLQLKPVSESRALVAPAIIAERATDRYSFDSFVIGPANALAYNGAKSVAENPGKFCNPLFLYGETGLGKTHLMWAIVNAISENQPKAVVRYITAQEFAADFVNSLDKGTVAIFRRNLEACSVLLVDDIGFLEGKNRTQEELFHIFNQLHQDGKQIVLSSDRPPRDHIKVDEKLRTRFECGLVADIQPPDTETRAEIVRRKAHGDGVKLDDEVCEFLAGQTPGNIRSLLGALTTLLVHASLSQAKPNVALAAQVIEKQFGRPEPVKASPEQIIRAVSSHFNVPVDQMVSSTRKAWIAHARHVAVYLLRDATGESWKRLGERFGGRDHSSIMHAYSKVHSLLDEDKELLQDVQALRRDLHLDK